MSTKVFNAEAGRPNVIPCNVVGFASGPIEAKETAIHNYNQAMDAMFEAMANPEREIAEVTTWEDSEPIAIDLNQGIITDHIWVKNSQFFFIAQDGDFNEDGSPAFQQDWIVGLPTEGGDAPVDEGDAPLEGDDIPTEEEAPVEGE